METSIISVRKQSLLQKLHSFRSHCKSTKRELLSFLDKVSFSCKVLPAGHIFIKRLIYLSTTVSRMHYHIRLTSDTYIDIQWWLDFLPNWSGKSLILKNQWTSSVAMYLFTDVSPAMPSRSGSTLLFISQF